jgi:hypothetical protein
MERLVFFIPQPSEAPECSPSAIKAFVHVLQIIICRGRVVGVRASQVRRPAECTRPALEVIAVEISNNILLISGPS